MRIKCNCILQLVSPPKQQNVNQNGICNTQKFDAVIHTGPWYQASVCERLVLSSVFGLVQSSRSTKHSRTCCYATSCRRQAVSNDHPRAGETWLSSDRQSLACPMMTTSETHSNSTIYETCNLQILATINTCRQNTHKCKHNTTLWANFHHGPDTAACLCSYRVIGARCFVATFPFWCQAQKTLTGLILLFICWSTVEGRDKLPIR